jgi:hypothetical protein
MVCGQSGARVQENGDGSWIMEAELEEDEQVS